MGNSNNYTQIEKFEAISSKQYLPDQIDDLLNQLQIIEEAKLLNLKLDDDINMDINIKNVFTKKYGLYLGIKRFAIPIIGVINSGKSTFLNQILNLNNILQIGDKVTTRFITIIRHDKNATIPEVYQVEIEKRNNENGFNFNEKGENLLKSNSNLTKLIKELNEDIEKNNSQNSEKYLYDIEKYFLIIKTRIPLFEGKYEKYGNLIDFMDIPGLDEVQNLTNDIFDDFIKIIFSNILFPLFIFDVKSFENDNSRNIIKKYFDLYTSATMNISSKNNEIKYDRGIYILNKIDLINEDIKEIFNTFISKYDHIDLCNGNIIYIKPEININFFGISANKLCLIKTGSFIENIFNDIVIEAKKTKNNSFKKFIREYLFSKYKIDLNKSKEEKEDKSLEKRLDLLNNNLKKNVGCLNNPKFSLQEYTFLSKCNSNIGNDEEEKNNENMISKIQDKIKDLIDQFLNFDFEGLIPNIKIKEIEEKKKSIVKKDIYNKEFINNINRKMSMLFCDKLIKFETIKDLIDSANNFTAFYNNDNIRIIFIGIISSGKTSLLNTIIGNNYYLLQTTLSECTKCIYRIRYSKTISFCESIIKKTKYGNYFEDLNETRIYDINQIKEKIKNLNKEGNFKYYTLYVPIEGLESFENKENIELIDLPGIKKDIEELKIDLKELINMSDGFIFNFNSLNIADENSQFIFTQIIKYIKDRSNNFDFNNCLFNLNFIDEIEEDLLDEKIKEFKELILKTLRNKIYTGNFLEKLAMRKKFLSSDNINMSFVSNLYYNQYQENVNQILSLKFITNDKLEDIYENLIEEYDEDKIKELISENNLKETYKAELENKISIIKEKTWDKESECLLKLSEFLIIFEKYKKILIKKYQSSRVENFFERFNSQVNFSKINNAKIMYQKINGYFLNLLFKLYYYNELCLNEGILENYKNKIDIKKSIIDKEYNRIKDIIDKNFADKINIIKDYKKEAISIIGNEQYLTQTEIFERIKELGYVRKLSNLFDLLYNDIKKIRLNFIYFCANEISNLLNPEYLQKILSLISYSFRAKDNSGIKKAALIFGGGFFASALGFYIATSAAAESFWLFGAIYTGYPALILGIKYLHTYLTDTNKHKIQNYFDEVIVELKKSKNNFIRSIEDKKKDFIDKLEKSNKISSEDISQLKKANYQKAFQDFIDLFE